VDLHAVSRPARTFTGDFYFVHEDEQGIWVVLGDVAGKGLPAAVTMAMIQEELDHRIAAWVEARSDPAEIMLHLHGFLEPILPANRFATAVVGHLRRDGWLAIANAGQCPPLVARRNGAIESFSSTGPVVGPLPNPRWSSRTTALKPGDTLLLYSDGLIETRSRGGEEFGLAAVRSALSSAACTEPSAMKINERILEAFDRHARGARDDDLTLVVMSR
jgi:sigma-B regulation protein RsbU (phosphoserine phosphatase)